MQVASNICKLFISCWIILSNVKNETKLEIACIKRPDMAARGDKAAAFQIERLGLQRGLDLKMTRMTGALLYRAAHCSTDLKGYHSICGHCPFKGKRSTFDRMLRESVLVQTASARMAALGCSAPVRASQSPLLLKLEDKTFPCNSKTSAHTDKQVNCLSSYSC